MVIGEDLALTYQTYYTHGSAQEGNTGLGASVIDLRFYRLDRWMTRMLRLEAERKLFASSYLQDVVPGSVLDVGCGGGIFSDILQRMGWKVRGSDFDRVAAQAATEKFGFPVDVGELTEIGYAAESFDAITVRHVIEHVPDPLKFLKECWRILKPGGRLVFITPNTASMGHAFFGSRWRGLEQPRHLFLYQASAMRALFDQADIQTAQVFSTAQGASFVAADSCRTSIGRVQRTLNFMAIWLLYLCEGLFTTRRHEIGEELVAVAVKAPRNTADQAG